MRFHLGAHLISAANDCRSILVLAIGQVFMRAIDSLEIIRQLSLSLSALLFLPLKTNKQRRQGWESCRHNESRRGTIDN